jgi:hypothetical protein
LSATHSAINFGWGGVKIFENPKRRERTEMLRTSGLEGLKKEYETSQSR